MTTASGPSISVADLEETAQRWHEDDHDGASDDCFCCCERCDPDYGGMNPWFAAWSGIVNAVPANDTAARS